MKKPQRKQHAVGAHPQHPGHSHPLHPGGTLLSGHGGIMQGPVAPGTLSHPGGKTHTRKHATAKKKQHASRKHRGLALSGLPVCAAEALAATLRLSGWPVTDADVLALYECTPGADGTGASILATLEAATSYGVAGMRPTWGSAGRDSNPQTPISGRSLPAGLLLSHTAPDSSTAPGAPLLILGVELPGAHTVAVAPDGCWLSWGEHYDPAAFPGAVIEEAWAVQWL